jgi:hypothetical protein
MKQLIKKTIWILSGLLLLVACASKKEMTTNALPPVFYPVQTDSAKVQYLTSFTTSFDIQKKQSSFNKAMVGNVAPLAIKKGYGVEYHKGRIYVSDIGLGGFDVIDLNTKKFTYFRPQGRGKLKGSVNASLDTNGDLYAVDISEKKVNYYTKEHQYIGSFGTAENIAPSDVKVLNDKIWVCDSKNNRINVYDKANKAYLDYFPKVAQGDDAFLYMPTNLDVGPDKIYVSDMGDGTVKVYNYQGGHIQTIGSFGTNMGQLYRPKGVAVDKEGNVYVVDANFQNIQIFDPEGQLLLFFGEPTGERGGMYLPTSVAISYDTDLFQHYVDPKYELKYLVFMANQFGPYRINVYGRIELK